MMTDMAGDSEKFDLDSIEAKLFRPLSEFYKKAIILLQKSPLRDEKAKVMVVERIKLVMKNVVDEMNRSKTFNMTAPLESAYEEIRCLVEELSVKENQ
ncbi:MAG: hypothetical protein WCJ35_12690 [Planctomycetota bacterium]